MNINKLCNFLDSLDHRLSVTGDCLALIGSIVLAGLVVCGAGYCFWYIVASIVYIHDVRVQFIIIMLGMFVLEGFRPALRWFRNRIAQRQRAI